MVENRPSYIDQDNFLTRQLLRSGDTREEILCCLKLTNQKTVTPLMEDKNKVIKVVVVANRGKLKRQSQATTSGYFTLDRLKCPFECFLI